MNKKFEFECGEEEDLVESDMAKLMGKLLAVFVETSFDG